MHKGTALLVLAAFMAVGLAGCSSGGGSDGFSVKAPSSPGGEYVFTASGSADNYTWDLGDRLTTMYGKSVHHTYDFPNGNITVVLTEKKGAQSEEHRKSITLGTGKNAQPTFILEGSTNWTITGEPITFTAHKSTDPDQDPLRYTWSCVRTGDAVRQPTHVHPGFGGVPFATPPAGSVTALNLVGPVPQADRKLTGDLCEALGSGGKPSKDTTISGSFTKTGIYDIYLLASDPVHPTTSGKYHLAVTKPEERPAPIFEKAFFGNMTGGFNGILEQGDGQTNSGDYDFATHSFTLPLTGGGAGWILTHYTGHSGVPGGNMSWELKRGTVPIASGGANDGNVTLPAAELKQSSYTLDVNIMGPGVDYTITVGVPLDLDPFKVY